MSAARRRPLEPIELAEAAVLSDVCVALCLLGWLFPFGTLLIAMAVAPMAALAGRHRLRAVIAGAVAGVIASLLVAGTGLAVNVVTCAVLGVVVGAALRRGWSRRATVAVAVGGLGPPAVALTLAVLALLSSLRRLALDQVANSWRGAARILRVLGLTSVVSAVDPVVAWLLRYWWVGIPIAVLATIMVSTWLAYSLARPTLTRLSAAVPPTRQPAAGHRSLLVREDVIPAPVPVSFDEASFRYPGATDDTVREVSFDIRPGEMVALVGPNGSGKSTLTRLLAGWSPTSGAIDRPGASGLGRTGGTALVFQRPETQVLGVRVQDDVMWGLGPESLGPARAALARVGLAGLADRETSTLSGGELQRLALAAAIARQPRLLISDESTAMIDPVGRAEVLALLRGLADDGTAVVHVTHRAEEAEVADRILVVDGGRVSEPGRSSPDRGVVAGARLAEMAVAGEPMPEGDGAAAPQPGPAVVIADRSSGLVVARLAADHVGDHTAARARVAAPPVTLERVGHVFSPGSPWAHRALSSVDLTIDAGEGVMVVGPNGSGKSTLAWILAGLLVPSEGLATLGDQPLDACLGAVGLAFQHPRLQLMRTTVRSDVRAASGTDVAGADDALRSVGLDPVRFAERRIDELSGGQQRRAALAGLLAGRPRLLVLDEPFAGLDRGGREGLSVVLGRLRAESGLTLVIVSHDLDVPASVADRVVRIDRGQVVEDRRIGAEPVSAALMGSSPDWRSATVRVPVSPPPSTLPSSTPLCSSTSVPPSVRPPVPPTGRPPVPGRTRRRRGGGELMLLRPVPGNSPIHRLWGGTKLIGLLMIAVVLSFRPTWPAIGIMGGAVVVGLAMARVPRGARPRLPRWLWFGILSGAALALVAGGSPVVAIGGLRLGVGALGQWARAISLSLVIVAGAALVSWTTPVAAIAPAISRLGAPLRLLRLPVDEWAASVALAFRCLPLLLDEVRTLAAVRRLRAPHRVGGHVDRRPWRRALIEPQDLLTAAMVVGLRRAGELARAMEARGGPAPISDDTKGPGFLDLLAIALVVTAAATSLLS